ncbi:alpha/beta fold hydrolase [Actinosynnema sp. NPDC023587]|uniref:alpha/beta hydrolase n=1 Tax=Actinosynnema sp. NPDC023587 TaxID=3154695 RepID=UPI0033D2C527
MRHSLAAGAAALLVASTLLTAPPADAASSCRDVYAPVTVLGHRETVHGELCSPAGGASAVQLLIPGSTYNSSYWHYDDGAHSFRDAQNAAGFATLAVDRLGTGASSKPPGLTLTSFVQAEAVHQVVRGLRSGAYGPAYRKVIIGGHSLGSSIAILAAGTHRDVDGVLVTGLTHRANPAGVVTVLGSMIPANLDPKFGLTYPLGYLTTSPGTRYRDFHAPGVLPPGLRAAEERGKDVFAPTEAVDGLGVAVLLPYSKLIDVPVMVVAGRYDSTVCGLLASNCTTAATLHAEESRYYRHLRTHVVEDYGHSINLAPNAGRYYSAVASWAREVVR